MNERDLRIRFELRLGGRALELALVGALLAGLAGESATESVNLTSYYPAPSAVYNNLITEYTTYLARDGGYVNIGVLPAGAVGAKLYVAGSVGVGVTSPAAGTSLEVNGVSRFDGERMFLTGTSFWFQTAAGSGNQFLHFTANGAGAASSVDMAPGGNLAPPALTAKLSGAGATLATRTGVQNTSPQTGLDVGGDGILTLDGASCRLVTYLSGVSVTPCNSGEYATLASGLYANYMVSFGPAYTNSGLARGSLLCCPCPSTGCITTFY